MEELVELLNRNYDYGENVPGWVISPKTFEDVAYCLGLEIVKRTNLNHERKEVWHFVKFEVSDGIKEKDFLTRTAW